MRGFFGGGLFGGGFVRGGFFFGGLFRGGFGGGLFGGGLVRGGFFGGGLIGGGFFGCGLFGGGFVRGGFLGCGLIGGGLRGGGFLRGFFGGGLLFRSRFRRSRGGRSRSRSGGGRSGSRGGGGRGRSGGVLRGGETLRRRFGLRFDVRFSGDDFVDDFRDFRVLRRKRPENDAVRRRRIGNANGAAHIRRARKLRVNLRKAGDLARREAINLQFALVFRRFRARFEVGERFRDDFVFRLRRDHEETAVGRRRRLRERRDGAQRLHNRRVERRRSGTLILEAVNLDDRRFFRRDFGRQRRECRGNLFVFRRRSDDENFTRFGVQLDLSVRRHFLQRVDDLRVKRRLRRRPERSAAHTARERPNVRRGRGGQAVERVNLRDRVFRRVGALLQTVDQAADDVQLARAAEVVQNVRLRVVKRFRFRREDVDLRFDRVVRNAFEREFAPFRNFRSATRAARVLRRRRRRIRVVNRHRGGVNFAQRVHRVDDEKRVSALRTQIAIRSLERRDRLANGVHTAAFERNRQRDVIETVLIRQVFRRDFRHILKRQASGAEVVQNQHFVIAEKRVAIDVKSAVEDVERVFRRVRDIAVERERSLRRRRHHQLQTDFGREPLKHVFPTFFGEAQRDRFFGNPAFEPFDLFGGENGFQRFFRLGGDVVPLRFVRLGELLRPFDHQLVDASGLHIGQADASGDARIKKTRITAFRVEIDFDRFGRRRRGRRRIRERFLHVGDHLRGRGRVLARNRDLFRARNADLTQRGRLLFRSRRSGRRRFGGRSRSGRGGRRRSRSRSGRGGRRRSVLRLGGGENEAGRRRRDAEREGRPKDANGRRGRFGSAAARRRLRFPMFIDFAHYNGPSIGVIDFSDGRILVSGRPLFAVGGERSKGRSRTRRRRNDRNRRGRGVKSEGLGAFLFCPVRAF